MIRRLTFIEEDLDLYRTVRLIRQVPVLTALILLSVASQTVFVRVETFNKLTPRPSMKTDLVVAEVPLGKLRRTRIVAPLLSSIERNDTATAEEAPVYWEVEVVLVAVV